jgi:hypothetical protein
MAKHSAQESVSKQCMLAKEWERHWGRWKAGRWAQVLVYPDARMVQRLVQQWARSTERRMVAALATPQSKLVLMLGKPWANRLEATKDWGLVGLQYTSDRTWVVESAPE